jgi:hypothetical protein
VSYSLNEIEALAKHAARGAGLPWGLAEEAGYCVRWLASFGLPGPQLLADLFIANEQSDLSKQLPLSLSGTWEGEAGTLCPIATGATLCDCAWQLADGVEFDLQNVFCPLLVLPFTAGAAKLQGLTVCLLWKGVSLETDGVQLSVQGDDKNLAADSAIQLRCFVSTGSCVMRPPTIRGEMHADCLETLSLFAQRSFAPATAESRELGAGSRDSYND